MIHNIIFAGTPPIAATTLTKLIQVGLNISACYTQPDRPKGRQQKLTFSAVKDIAISYNIPIFQPESLKNLDVINTLQKLNPDLLIVFVYGLILPKEILMIPKFGCFNIHTSLLPKWRGAAPVQHAILAGDHETGISIIKMEIGLDTGDVFYSIKCPITNIETSESLYNKLQPLATTAILEVVRQLNANQIAPIPQDHAHATYANKINKLDAKINWALPAMQIDRIIRAFVPTPVAFTEILNLSSPHENQTNVRIWQASISDSSKTTSMDPGSIVNVNKHGIDVATSDGILRLEKLQFPGGKILNIAELLNSHKHKDFLERHAKFN